MGTLIASLIPSSWKFYLEGAAVIAAAVYISWFLHHERQIGRDEVTAAQNAAVAAQKVTNAKIEQLAQDRIDQALTRYRTANAAPVVDPIHVSVCTPANSRGGSSARGDASASAGSHGSAGIQEAVGPVHAADIGPYTDNLLDAADDQIVYLQSYIRACQEKGICHP